MEQEIRMPLHAPNDITVCPKTDSWQHCAPSQVLQQKYCSLLLTAPCVLQNGRRCWEYKNSYFQSSSQDWHAHAAPPGQCKPHNTFRPSKHSHTHQTTKWLLDKEPKATYTTAYRQATMSCYTALVTRECYVLNAVMTQHLGELPLGLIRRGRGHPRASWRKLSESSTGGVIPESCARAHTLSVLLKPKNYLWGRFRSNAQNWGGSNVFILCQPGAARRRCRTSPNITCAKDLTDMV